MSHINGLASFQHQFGTGYSTAPARPLLVRGSARKVLSGPSPRDPISLTAASGFLGLGLFESDARLEKVAALQLAIVSGTYSVSAADLADKLLHSLSRPTF